MAACIRCAGSFLRVCGSCSFPGSQRRLLQVRGPDRGWYLLEKADPYARPFEVPPRSASVIWEDGGFEWNDDDWLRERGPLVAGTTGRCRSTRCTSDRGDESRMKAIDT